MNLDSTIVIIAAMSTAAAPFVNGAVNITKRSAPKSFSSIYPPLAVLFGVLFLSLLLCAADAVPNVPPWLRYASLILLGGFSAALQAIGLHSLGDDRERPGDPPLTLLHDEQGRAVIYDRPRDEGRRESV